MVCCRISKLGTKYFPRKPSTLSPQVVLHHLSSVMQSSHGWSVGHADNKMQKLPIGKLVWPKCEKWEHCWSSEQSWRHSSTKATPGNDATRLFSWISQAWSWTLQAPIGKSSRAREQLAKRARNAHVGHQSWCEDILHFTEVSPILIFVKNAYIRTWDCELNASHTYNTEHSQGSDCVQIYNIVQILFTICSLLTLYCTKNTPPER